ncbi:hypothetical protein IAT40_005613 [Kwoniella sp. CBS 6097]
MTRPSAQMRLSSVSLFRGSLLQSAGLIGSSSLGPLAGSNDLRNSRAGMATTTSYGNVQNYRPPTPSPRIQTLPRFGLSARTRPQLSPAASRSRLTGSPRYLSTTPVSSSPLEPPMSLSHPQSSLSPTDDLVAATASATDDALTPISTIFDPLIDPLSSFLLSLPHPFGYGTTIIVLTLLVRTVFTLPVSLWQRKRAMKARRLVDPQMKIINAQLAESLVAESRKKGLTYKQYVLELRRQLAEAQSTLHRLHGTNPTITTWSPLLVHIPIFVTLSLTIRKTLEMPSSPVFSESFFWLEKLGEVDPYGILPLVGMSMAFGNAELVGRRNKAAADSAADAVRVQGEGKESFDGSASSNGSELSQSNSGNSPPPRRESTLFASRKPTSSRKTSSSSSTSPPTASSSSSSSSVGRPRRLSTSTSSLIFSSTPSFASNPSSAPKPRAQARTSRQVVATSRSKQGSVADSSRVLVDADANERSRSSFTPARQQEIRRNFMAGVLRFSALGFGMIASQMPAGVVLYWVTSIAFSLVQNVLLSWLPQKRLASSAANAALASSTKTTTTESEVVSTR